MKITTKTGDKGETSLFGGRRVSKASDFIRVVGDLDELQAVVGWCHVEAAHTARHGALASAGREQVDGGSLQILERVTDDLYRMMSVVGFEFKCPGNIRAIDESDVEFLEGFMAKHEAEMDKVKAFVRPGGSSELAARLHIARTVCRRVERGMVEVGGDREMLKYLNRLSDLLFVLAQVT